MKFIKNRRIANVIVVVVIVIFLMAAIISSFIGYTSRQESVAFMDLHRQRAIVLAQSAIEAAVLKVKEEANVFPDNPFTLVKNYLKALKNPTASWFLKFRVPAFALSGGITGQSFMHDYSINAFLSVEGPPLNLPMDWAKKTYSAKDLKLEKLIKDLHMDGRAKVSVTVDFKQMRPIMSDEEGTILWEGAVTDDSEIQAAAKRVGTWIFEHLNLPDEINIEVGKYVTEAAAKCLPYADFPIIKDVVKWITDWITNSDFMKKYATIKIPIRKWLEKALDKIIKQLKIGDIEPISAKVVLEKLGTLDLVANVEYSLPYGKTYKIKVHATKDVKVIDIQPPNPLYSFYWKRKGGSKPTLSSTGGGLFEIRSFPFTFNDMAKILKGDFSPLTTLKALPGMIFVGAGGGEKHKIDTDIQDLLLLIGQYNDFLPRFPGYGFSHASWTFPSAYFGKIPVDAFVPDIPGVPNLCFGWGSLATVIKNTRKGGLFPGKVRLFGPWAVFPTINLSSGGNFYKRVVKLSGYCWPWIYLLFVTIPGGCMWTIRREETPYGYGFYNRGVTVRFNGKIENLYTPSQYRKKATYVYYTWKAFESDKSIRDKNGVIFLDGVIFIDTRKMKPAVLKGKFYGTGMIVVNGDVRIDGDIRHEPYVTVNGKKKKAPFSIICFGKITTARKVKVEAAVYAQNGVAVGKGGKMEIRGNLVCREFYPKDIKGDLIIRYDSRYTIASFGALIPYVSRYVPDRYYVVISRQYSSYKVYRTD